jgi:hypothetical protein
MMTSERRCERMKKVRCATSEKADIAGAATKSTRKKQNRPLLGERVSPFLSFSCPRLSETGIKPYANDAVAGIFYSMSSYREM